MGIWNEGEMPGKKEFRNPLKYGRQFKARTKEPHGTASQCETNMLLNMCRRISRNEWGLASQSSFKSDHSQPTCHSCNTPRPDVFSHEMLHNIPCCTKCSRYDHWCV